MSKLELSSLYQLTMVRFRLFSARAGGDLLDLYFSDPAGGGAGHRLPQPAGGCAAGGRDDDATDAGAGRRQGADGGDDGRGRRHHALATGSILLLAIQRPDGVVYKYDDTNPDARTARLWRIGRFRRPPGGTKPIHVQNQLVHETGARYIDFVVPGLLGMNLMGSAMWGLGFSIVEARQKKLLKRLVASPMPRWQYLASFLLSRLVMLVIEVVVFLGFARLAFGVPFRGSLLAVGIAVRAYFAGIFRAGAAGRFARQDHGGCLGTDESGDAAHVDSSPASSFRRRGFRP